MIEYCIATEQDAQDIATIHSKCFPDYFLTKLDGGKGKVLGKLYESSVGEDRILIVAKEKDNIIGFVMGFILPNNNPREILVKKHFWLLVRRMLVLLLKFNKMAWNRVGREIKRLFSKKQSYSPQVESMKKACLLSIGVLPEYRGKGVSVELIRMFEQACRDAGVEYYGLSALKENDRGNAFYRKMGLLLKSQDDKECHYYKLLDRGGSSAED